MVAVAVADQHAVQSTDAAGAQCFCKPGDPQRLMGGAKEPVIEPPSGEKVGARSFTFGSSDSTVAPVPSSRSGTIHHVWRRWPSAAAWCS